MPEPMTTNILSPLQRQILEQLAGMEPPWTLTGGAALVGFYLQHRTTKDLDLFWHGKEQLDRLPEEVAERLRRQGWQVESLQSSPSFHRLRVASSSEVVLVDLVAETVPTLEPPQQVESGTTTLYLDTPYEILVNKFCALLSRSELRDLQDIQEILHRNPSVELEQILMDASRKDGGFSPLTLAWTLKGLPLERLAMSLSWSQKQVEELARFRDSLVRQLLQLAQPPS